MFKIRPYQAEAERQVYDAWRSARNVALVLPTGSGKTVIFTDIIRQHNGPSCAIAHRQELVSQISLALAREGVRHNIIGPPSIIKLCVSQHMAEIGTSYYDLYSPCAVAGIDTLIRRTDKLRTWAQSVTLWVMDEAHHLLRENKWGEGISIFPNARGLGVTATFVRTDGKGLGRHTDGVFDTIITGPTARQLINEGYLTDYRIFAPKSDIDLSDVPISIATGDYTLPKLKIAVRKSRIVGDVVDHYIRIAMGKLGVTFATDVETAGEIAVKFNVAGIPTEMVHAETPPRERIATIQRFRNREILQLVNVDLFGEGFDLPAVEVVSMARPTKSYGLYVQQFGRGLRVMVSPTLCDKWATFTNTERRGYISASGKPHAIIIDHVNNVDPRAGGHGLPDTSRQWTLSRREKRESSLTNVTPIRVCPACTGVYSRYLSICPYCGQMVQPARRDGPDFVDGDLTELDATTLAKMRGEVDKIDMPVEDFRAHLTDRHVPPLGIMANVKRHAATQSAQMLLRNTIAWWAGYQRAAGRSDSESYKRFYIDFGVDVMSAKVLHEANAQMLNEKIIKAIEKINQA
jgi:DNA repair protein RadD